MGLDLGSVLSFQSKLEVDVIFEFGGLRVLQWETKQVLEKHMQLEWKAR